MTSICYLCDSDVIEEDTYTQCDGCDSLFHLECSGKVNARKTDVVARKNSKCLKLYCPDCFKTKIKGTSAKLSEVLTLLYRMDFCLQEQKTSNVTASIERKLDALDKKMTSHNATTDSAVNRRNTNAAYASVVKNGNVKPAVVIKPKSKQSSSKTFEEISGKIDKNELNICGTRNARDGGVILRCANSTETLKAKQIVNEKLGPDYEVILPKIKQPRVRVTNILPDIPNDSIIDELKKHNDQIKEFDMRLITVIPRKSRSTTTNEAVVEVSSESFNKLMEISVLNLPWRECKLFEHLHVNRCYKCCGFFHKSTECKLSQKCSRCAGPHKHSECRSKRNCCVNCKNANDKFKLNLDTNHHAWNNQCPIYKRRLTSVRNKIEYNESE